MELPSRTKANLLLVFTDEQRASATGLETPEVLTPHLNALAAGGVRFARAVSNFPVCTPMRGSMLTGVHPYRHGAIANDLAIRADVTSIAHVLKTYGYCCGYVGKWHLGGIPRYRFIPPGRERLGFDDFWAVWNCHHQYLRAKYLLDKPEPIFADGYEPAVQVDLAIDFLKRHVEADSASPFCLFLSWGPPHGPYFPQPPQWKDAYDPQAIRLPANCPDTPANRRDLAAYYAHVSACDEQLGRLLAFLGVRGLAESTLVVFTSDHGSMLGSHRRYNKQQPFRESTLVPLVIRGPGLPSGTVRDEPIGLMDLPATLLGLLGIPVPGAMDGRDLSGWARGDASAAPADSVYIACQLNVGQAALGGVGPWRGVITSRYTYARSPQGPWVLFDDQTDPWQLRNLAAAGGADRRVLSELEALTQQWMRRFDDPFMDTEAILKRFGLAQKWAESQKHLAVPENMAGVWPGRP